MANKLIITEGQLVKLKNYLVENNLYGSIVGELKTILDNNYEPMIGVMREGGEYFEKAMIKIKSDGESISPKSLLDYMTYKYKYSRDFIKQVIIDWMFGRIEDNKLTKNIAIN